MDPSTTITRLFTALSALSSPPPAPPRSIIAPAPPNVLHRLTQPSASAARTILLTLHLLFPHDFLPALNLLDRGLVSCLTSPPARASTSPAAHPAATGATGAREVWYVQSASAVTEAETSRGGGGGGGGGRYRHAMRGKATDTFYEVRLDSWNCSCAGFAFQAFSLLRAGDEDEEEHVATDDIDGEGSNVGKEGQRRLSDFRFGGTSAEVAVAPVCKHILAAAVARNLPDFAMPEGRDGREWRREVNMQELAGWGAAWGDRG